MSGPCIGHIGRERDERAPADGEAPAVLHTAAADAWVHQRFPGLAPEIASALAHAFEAGFNAGGDRAIAVITVELCAQGMTDLAKLINDRWQS